MVFSFAFARVLAGATFALGLINAISPVSAQDKRDRGFSVAWEDTGLNKTLNRVQFSGNRGWAVGEGGAILLTEDAGRTWKQLERKTEQTLYGLHFADEKTGWVVGASGAILATTDGGLQWQPQTAASSRSRRSVNTLRSVHFAKDRETGWAVGLNGTIIATSNAGSDWRLQKSPTDRNLSDVHAIDQKTAWAVGTLGTIASTSDGGQTWELRESGVNKSLLAIFFADESTGWIAGNDGTILATTDKGVTWRQQTSNTDKTLRDVRFIDTKTGWAVGDDGTVVTTTDGGGSWHVGRGFDEKDAYFSIHVSDAHAAVVVGTAGSILTTTDAGLNWQVQRRGTNKALWDVHFPKGNSGVGWSVGAGGTILATRDGGKNWHTQRLDTETLLNGVHFVDEKSGFVIGDDGLILKTHDAGKNWQRLAEGLTEANLSGVYFVNERLGWAVGGEGGNGAIFATKDGGENWQQQTFGPKPDSAQSEFVNAVHFIDENSGWAVGTSGLILRTSDAGKNWKRVEPPLIKFAKTDFFRVRFLDTLRGWIVGDNGAILATSDGGKKWIKQPSGVRKKLYHVYFANLYSGWVVGEGGTLLATRDGGVTWRQQTSSSTADFNAVYFINNDLGWIVGSGGIMMRAGGPAYAPWPEHFSVVPQGGPGDALKIMFEIPSADKDLEAVLEAKPGNHGFKEVRNLARSGDGWEVTWKPASDDITSSGTIDFQARLIEDDDALPPLGVIPLASHSYNPWLTELFQKYILWVAAFLSAFGLLIGYAIVLAVILAVRPASMARWGSAPLLDDLPKASGTLGLALEAVRRAFGSLLVPWICQLPRVRRAWTKQYIAGTSTFDDLGKARASFVSSPDVLDAWVARVTPKVEAALCQLDLYAQRRIYVELPVRVGEGGKVIDRPNAETLRELFSKERAIVGIVGGGGAGKSTLACALARWAMCPDPTDRIAPHKMIPVFIMQDTTNLIDAVTQNLRRMLGDENLPDDLVRGLLAKQRVLVILDALSERGPDTQAHIEQVFGQQNMPVNAIVITSRTEPKLINVDRTVLRPVRLDAARVVPFIIGYLDRMEEDVGQLKNGRLQLRLGDQILALAESGGQKTPITPLLVTLFVNSAVQRAVDAHSFDDMPQAVPEVFVDYLRRVFAAPAQGEENISDDIFIQAAQTLATASLGSNMVPQDFTMDDAVAALAAGMPDWKPRVLIDRLDRSGVIERRTPGGYVALRFSLDPAAEYLAAIRQLFKMKRAGTEDWTKYLVSLMQVNGYPRALEGYLVALATCYRAYKRDFSLPDMQFPWEKVGERPPSAAPAMTVAAE